VALPFAKTIRRLIAGLLLLLALLIALPYILGAQPFRDWMLRAVLPVSEGTVTSGGASLGWFSRVRFYDIRIRSLDGEPVVTIPVFEGSRPLIVYLLTGKNLGTFRIERPELNVVATGEGTNLQRVFAQDGPQGEPPDVSVAVEIVDASLTFRSPHAVQPWGVEDLNLSVALESSESTESGRTEIVVHPGTVFNRTPITPQMCDDMLKYIAPVLAEATNISGEFSIELDGWRLPAEEPKAGRGSGRLTVHSIDVSPGPLVRSIARALGLPASVRLADKSVVDFEMADGRVEHRGVEFGIGQLRVRTHGSVGLDETLDIVAEIPIPSDLFADRPALGMLSGKTIKIPIRGTLSEPKVDAAALARSNIEGLLGDVDIGKLLGDSNLGELLGNPDAGAALDILGDLLKNRAPPGERILDRLLPQNGTPERPLLDRFRRRRNGQ